MSDQHEKHDDELTPYLDGRDGVSAAYRRHAREQPPAALDRTIMNAAGAAVQPTPHSRFGFSTRQAMAASAMVGVFSAALYLSWQDVPSPGERITAAQSDQVLRTEESLVTLPEATLVPPAAGASAEVAELPPASVESAPRAANFSERRLATAVPVVPATPTSVSTGQSDAQAQSTELASRAAEAAEQRVIISGRALEQIEEAAAAALATSTVTAVAASTAQPLPAQEEIQVTGSRVRRASDVDPAEFRGDQAAWVAQIGALTAQLERTTEPTARAELQAQLQQERALFAQAYPAANLEALLQAAAKE